MLLLLWCNIMDKYNGAHAGTIAKLLPWHVTLLWCNIMDKYNGAHAGTIAKLLPWHVTFIMVQYNG